MGEVSQDRSDGDACAADDRLSGADGRIPNDSVVEGHDTSILRLTAGRVQWLFSGGASLSVTHAPMSSAEVNVSELLL